MSAGLLAILAIIDNEQENEVLAYELHHGTNPLVEGLTTEPSCSKISGNFSETIDRNFNGTQVESKFSRNLLDNDTVSSNALLPGLSIDSTISEPFLDNDEVTSTIKDKAGNVVETRHSVLHDNFLSADTLDTTVLDANNQVKETIQSTRNGFWGNDIDTVVKDASGKVLRELNSTYESNTFSPDSLCTRLK